TEQLMAFSLSFSDSFFRGNDECSRIQPCARPTSVYQAIISIEPRYWDLLAREVFNADPEHLDPETVMARILETNLCRNLDPPVEVLIDAEGYHTILVYEERSTQ